MKHFMALLFLFVLTFSGLGQNYFQGGNKYVSFEVSRSPAISGGYFFDDRSAVNMGIILHANGQKKTTGFGLQLGFDRYMRFAVLTPFFGGGVRFSINPNAYGGESYKGTQIILDGHWGIHLFVIKGLAIAGKIGGEVVFDTPKKQDTTISFKTFSSGLEIRFFF
jgi:hypothetical protein